MSSSARTSFQIQRDVVYALLLREIASRFGKSRVGFLWVLVEPIAHLVFPITILGFMMERTIPGVEYPVFLTYGLLPFLLFKTICLQTMDGTRANRGLLSYRQVLLMDVFVAKALTHCAVYSIVFAVVLGGLALLGFDVLPSLPIELFGVLALTVAMAFGLGMLFAALGSVSPDLKSILRLIFIPLYFLSGILFPISRFPEDWLPWLALNPVLHVVELSRHAALRDYVLLPELGVGNPLALAIAGVFMGLALYRLRWLSRVTA
jgi:capsular polysaccharide transport system permease protein